MNVKTTFCASAAQQLPRGVNHGYQTRPCLKAHLCYLDSFSLGHHIRPALSSNVHHVNVMVYFPENKQNKIYFRLIPCSPELQWLQLFLSLCVDLSEVAKLAFVIPSEEAKQHLICQRLFAKNLRLESTFWPDRKSTRLNSSHQR